jgi:hypothetical protein
MPFSLPCVDTWKEGRTEGEERKVKGRKEGEWGKLKKEGRKLKEGR